MTPIKTFQPAARAAKHAPTSKPAVQVSVKPAKPANRQLAARSTWLSPRPAAQIPNTKAAPSAKPVLTPKTPARARLPSPTQTPTATRRLVERGLAT